MDTESLSYGDAFGALSRAEFTTLNALFEQLFPTDENGPGASSIGVIQYLDRALGGPYALHLEAYRLGVGLGFMRWTPNRSIDLVSRS